MEGEAKAKLAAMNSVGTIDAVMTDDSDMFTFGWRYRKSELICRKPLRRKMPMSRRQGKSCPKMDINSYCNLLAAVMKVVGMDLKEKMRQVGLAG